MKEMKNHEQISYDSQTFPFACSLNKQLTSLSDEAQRSVLWHEEFEIKYMVRGCVEIVCGDRVYLAKEGDLVIINPCELHTTRLIQQQPCIYHLIMISPEVFHPLDTDNDLQAVCDGKLRFETIISGNTEAHRELLLAAKELQQRSTAYKLSAMGHLTQMMSRLLREHTVSFPDTPQSDLMQRYAQRLAPAYQLIAEQYQSDLTLTRLAESCGMSACHFCHVFRQVTGKTAISYLTQLRINKAELLLHASDMSVSDVAAAVGFTDSAYFSKVYRKYKGCPPSRQFSK